MADKRKSSPFANGAGSSTSLVKRARQGDENGAGSASSQQVAITSDGNKGKGLMRTVRRTSSLSSPIISLSGAHQGEILDVKFSPDGQTIAAASADRNISLWDTFGDNANKGVLSGHSKAVTSIAWSPNASRSAPRLFSASADATVIVWDAATGQKLRRLRGHKGIINSLACARSGRDILVSGGDDGRVMLWEPNERDALDVIDVGYPVTAVAFSDDSSQIYVGGLDNDIHVYDLFRKEIVFSLRGHLDTITSLALSPDGTHLLSASMDRTARIWDVQPFAPEPGPGHRGSPRLQITLEGVSTGFESTLIKASWDGTGRRAASGGGDGTCTIWRVDDGEIVYKLPGHRGTCTAVSMHPREPVIVSASTDTTMILGEIEP